MSYLHLGHDPRQVADEQIMNPEKLQAVPGLEQVVRRSA
jgi:hypothetical protein